MLDSITDKVLILIILYDKDNDSGELTRLHTIFTRTIK